MDRHRLRLMPPLVWRRYTDRRQGDTVDDTDPTMSIPSRHTLQDMEFGTSLSAIDAQTPQRSYNSGNNA